MKNHYTISADGATITIYLKRHSGKIIHCQVDAADLPKLQAFNVSWSAKWVRSVRRLYAGCNWEVDGKKTTLSMHRFLMEPAKGLKVVHKNRNSLDNRRSNLRIATHSETCMNRRGAQSNSKTGHRGIHPDSATGKFKLSVTTNGERKTIGFYGTIEEALIARSQLPEYAKTHGV